MVELVSDAKFPANRERTGNCNPAPNQRLIDETFRRASRLFNALAKTKFAASWTSYIDNTSDGVPVIGEVPAVSGFILAAGFSGHGFGSGAGHLVADF